MQILVMTIEINGKTFDLTRDTDQGVPVVRVRQWDGPGGYNRGVSSRQTAFDLAAAIARDAYGERRRTGEPACTNSMISDIADAIERVAGC